MNHYPGTWFKSLAGGDSRISNTMSNNKLPCVDRPCRHNLPFSLRGIPNKNVKIVMNHVYSKNIRPDFPVA